MQKILIIEDEPDIRPAHAGGSVRMANRKGFTLAELIMSDCGWFEVLKTLES